MAINFKETSFLIVDDQRAFQLMLKALLVNLGARDISLASSGEAAVGKSRRRPFDIVLIDYNLGNRKKNGRQLLEELKEKNFISAHTVTIIITGESHRPMVLGAIELQPDDYLMKPFSLNVLRQRMERAYIKRNSLLLLHQYMKKAQYQAAIPICKQLILDFPKYTNYCQNILAELYFKTEQYNKAEQLVTASLKQQTSSWAQVHLARIYLAQKKYRQAVQVAQTVIKISPLIIDSYDIMTDALIALDEPARSLEMAIKASELSPYSVKRQQKLVAIAQQNELYEIACETNRFILEMTRHSVQQDIQHSFNYIRSVINAAEQAVEKHEQNKYMQEASLALQRARNDDTHNSEQFNAFERLCRIRLEAIHGNLNTSKQKIYQFLQHEKENQQNFVEFIFEKSTIMNRIGEFEQADAIIKAAQNNGEDLDPQINLSLQLYNRQYQDKASRFNQLNLKGIQAYNEKKYADSVHAFEQALTVAPYNTGCMLNLILACLKQAHEREKMAADTKYKLTTFFKNLAKIPLPAKQQKRYQDLSHEFSKWANLSA
ncbi:response regulator [Gayadomonas joobiniege]|uniref:response regulator n=1 Tax=Gayadomonas joobiniege TaxID=1234606 RepID=UPI000374AB71|nr:response regulator [Gayadomonas joobiniege]